MALNDENSGIPATMLVGPANYGAMPYPAYGGGYGNSGFGMDGNGWWIVLLFILLAGGRGFGGWGGYGGGEGFGGTVVVDNNSGVQRGFDQAAIMSGINGVRDGVTGLSTQLCNCCGDIQMALANGFAGVEQGANARQIANMQTAFAGQTAMAQGFNSLASQFADCCCENRLGIADLKYTVATENCADRAALNDGVRDIIANQTAGIQRILDQLCADKIDAKNDTIAQLRQELLFARGQASQDVQTADLRANNATVANQLLAEMRSCPIPAQPVYGSTPIFTCPTSVNNGCGCGCNNGF